MSNVFNIQRKALWESCSETMRLVFVVVARLDDKGEPVERRVYRYTVDYGDGEGYEFMEERLTEAMTELSADESAWIDAVDVECSTLWAPPDLMSDVVKIEWVD